MPGIRQVLAAQGTALDELEADVKPTWEGTVEPLEAIVDRLSRAWGTVSHLKVRPGWRGRGRRGDPGADHCRPTRPSRANRSIESGCSSLERLGC